MSSSSDIQPILSAAREAAGLAASTRSSSSEEEETRTSSPDLAAGTCPETADKGGHVANQPDGDVAEGVAAPTNACSICGYRRRFADDAHNFGTCEANVRECTASPNVPAPFRTQACTCSAARVKRCALSKQCVWDVLLLLSSSRDLLAGLLNLAIF